MYSTVFEWLGHQETVRRLQSWLVEWDDNPDGGESDEVSSDDEESRSQNTALLMWPSGTRKTCSVYSLAREMGFKVIEVNSSSCRNGKALLSNLREATQSHSVRKDESSKEPARKTLILLEEVDVVFDDLDDGFVSAVCTLISTTKRPIVLTTSCQNYLSLQKMKGISRFISHTFRFGRVNGDVVADHLQLLCLAEGFFVSQESLKRLSEKHGNCISSSLHNLEFSVMSLPRKESGEKPLKAEEFTNLIRAERNGQVAAEGNLESFDVPVSIHPEDNTDLQTKSEKEDFKSQREIRESFEVGIATSASKFSKETLPYLREIARIEDKRRNNGQNKRSKFLHHFEMMEIFMSSESLRKLIEAFS